MSHTSSHLQQLSEPLEQLVTSVNKAKLCLKRLHKSHKNHLVASKREKSSNGEELVVEDSGDLFIATLHDYGLSTDRIQSLLNFPKSQEVFKEPYESDFNSRVEVPFSNILATTHEESPSEYVMPLMPNQRMGRMKLIAANVEQILLPSVLIYPRVYVLQRATESATYVLRGNERLPLFSPRTIPAAQDQPRKKKKPKHDIYGKKVHSHGKQEKDNFINSVVQNFVSFFSGKKEAVTGKNGRRHPKDTRKTGSPLIAINKCELGLRSTRAVGQAEKKPRKLKALTPKVPSKNWRHSQTAKASRLSFIKKKQGMRNAEKRLIEKYLKRFKMESISIIMNSIKNFEKKTVLNGLETEMRLKTQLVEMDCLKETVGQLKEDLHHAKSTWEINLKNLQEEYGQIKQELLETQSLMNSNCLTCSEIESDDLKSRKDKGKTKESKLDFRSSSRCSTSTIIPAYPLDGEDTPRSDQVPVLSDRGISPPKVLRASIVCDDIDECSSFFCSNRTLSPSVKPGDKHMTELMEHFKLDGENGHESKNPPFHSYQTNFKKPPSDNYFNQNTPRQRWSGIGSSTDFEVERVPDFSFTKGKRSSAQDHKNDSYCDDGGGDSLRGNPREHQYFSEQSFPRTMSEWFSRLREGDEPSAVESLAEKTYPPRRQSLQAYLARKGVELRQLE